MNAKETDVFIDMDGVLAKWNTGASVEDTFEPGYFYDREPDRDFIIALMTIKKKTPAKFHVLSAVYNDRCAREKEAWLDWHVPVTFDSLIFVPYGSDKSEFIPADKIQRAILIDDFSSNLIRWEQNNDLCYSGKYIGVKYLNGINDTHHTWRGYRIGLCPRRTLESELLSVIESPIL